MSNLTFIIPIGESHTDLAQRAIDSALAQTVPCEVKSMIDTARRGPGALRNTMLMQVTTEFVSFLDADDWIESTFAEDLLGAYQKAGGNVYVFPDWFDERGVVVESPCMNIGQGGVLSTPDRKPYCGGTWHPLTTLIPTAWVRAVNGFDEQLPAAEDTEFYLKLCTTFRCGIRFPKPLFHYSANGKRSHEFYASKDYNSMMGEITRRHGGKMGCCGDKTAIAKPIGEKQDSDVLAMALWHGNRTEFGRVSKRNYPRLSFPRTAWVDPRDVEFSPSLWQRIENTVDAKMGLQSVAEIAQYAMQGIKQNPYAPPTIEPNEIPHVEAKPNVARVMDLSRKALHYTGDPIFVFPEKDYPSYGDIMRLAVLSGFEIVTPKKIDPFGRRPYIVVSPEPPGQLNGLRAHIICWQLEYAGDYTHNYDNLNVDIWASDKAWADEHGAKYVLMGSHPDLGPHEFTEDPNPEWDVTMLGYMTPRRQAIKDSLANLRWPNDYPGHEADGYRARVLQHTRLMLHVHQHDNAPYVAPQRIAIAAAYKMPVVIEDTPGLDDGLFERTVSTSYENIPIAVHAALETNLQGTRLHDYLCSEHTFRNSVMEALK